jgi:DNA repair protein RecN (Recombination protein N)
VLLCESLSKVRQDVANSIKADVELFLKSLGMTKVRFDISVEKKDKFSEQGYDDVVFLIATNTDKELTSLANVASGGETSRVMLAIKAVLAKAARHKTFIFDEIDTGVSGMAAQKVAESLVRFSATNQILCITHLPQIAAMADNHFKIVKIYEQNKTITTINLLDKYECVLELARLTSGVKITESTMAAANDLKETAIELKEHIRV